MFKFSLPVKVFFGELDKFASEFYEYGSNALIVTDKSSITNGALSDVLIILQEHNIKYKIFNDVEENPSAETVARIANEENGFDTNFIVAIGGGSVIDAAKAAGVLIAHQSLDIALLFQNNVKDKQLPVLAVPTTAGSGSEATSSAILTIHKKKTKVSIKRRVLCNKAFLNPRYTYSLPIEVTLSTTIDVLTHLIEGYMSVNANYLTDKFVEGGFVGFAEILPNIKNRIFDDAFREKMLLLSTLGGFIIANTRTTLPHLMSYPLTYNKGIMHGFSCGLLTYEYLKYHQNKSKLGKMLALMGFSGINQLGAFLADECPFLKIRDEEIQFYANIVWEDQERLLTHPFEVIYNDIICIYRNTFSTHS